MFQLSGIQCKGFRLRGQGLGCGVWGFRGLGICIQVFSVYRGLYSVCFVVYRDQSSQVCLLWQSENMKGSIEGQLRVP